MAFTLMKSKNGSGKDCPTGITAYEQQEVARFSAFENAVEQCSAANGSFPDRHYAMNESGKEYFLASWVD
jgi:hypothetical protein